MVLCLFNKINSIWKIYYFLKYSGYKTKEVIHTGKFRRNLLIFALISLIHLFYFVSFKDFLIHYISNELNNKIIQL